LSPITVVLLGDDAAALKVTTLACFLVDQNCLRVPVPGENVTAMLQKTRLSLPFCLDASPVLTA
jgi:hypothetical protein